MIGVIRLTTRNRYLIYGGEGETSRRRRGTGGSGRWTETEAVPKVKFQYINRRKGVDRNYSKCKGGLGMVCILGEI